MADYRAAGYDFLSITDHRMVTKPDPAEIPEGLVMIPGIELDYTMPDQWVHIQGLGVTEAVMDNYDRNGNPQDGIDRINECGGLAMLNHPAWSLNPPEYIASLKGVFGAEVWNSVSTIPYNAIRADSSSLLDVAASRGADMFWLANDDVHFYGTDFAHGWNMVQAEEKTAERVPAALAAGRFYATQGPVLHQVVCDGKHGTCAMLSRVGDSALQQFAMGRRWALRPLARDLTAGRLQHSGFRAPSSASKSSMANEKSAWTSPVKVK